MKQLIEYLDNNYNGWRELAVILAVLSIVAVISWGICYVQIMHTDAGLFDSRKNVEGEMK